MHNLDCYIMFDGSLKHLLSCYRIKEIKANHHDIKTTTGNCPDKHVVLGLLSETLRDTKVAYLTERSLALQFRDIFLQTIIEMVICHAMQAEDIHII